MTPARRPRGGCASRSAHGARSAHASGTAGGGAARAGHLRELAVAFPAPSHRLAASAAGQHGTLMLRCGAAVAALLTCVSAANRAG